MISNISGRAYQPLLSTPSNVIVPTAHTGADQSADAAQRPTPDSTDAQKVRPTVNSQESQAGKKQAEPEQAKQTAAKQPNSPTELDQEELKQVQELKHRDREVRAHEAAHLAAAGQHAQGGIKLTLQRGPDGKSYAVGGSVSIDTSPAANPEATIRKADQIRRAALAPAEPSGQDRSVAAEATQMKLEAQVKLAREQREAADDGEEAATSGAGSENTGTSNDGGEIGTDKPEPVSDVERTQAAAEALCEVCSGNHPTGPHLEANQRKAGAYTSISQV